MHIDPNKYQLKTKKEGNQTFIWDPIRKKYLSFTPEEMVRQYLIEYFQDQLNYPIALISVEKGLIINGLPKRYDIVLYDNTGKPKVLVECKAPSVKLSNEVFEQAASYNIQLQVEYLLISNGAENFIAEIDYDNLRYKMIEELPRYQR